MTCIEFAQKAWEDEQYVLDISVLLGSGVDWGAKSLVQGRGTESRPPTFDPEPFAKLFRQPQVDHGRTGRTLASEPAIARHSNRPLEVITVSEVVLCLSHDQVVAARCKW